MKEQNSNKTKRAPHVYFLICSILGIIFSQLFFTLESAAIGIIALFASIMYAVKFSELHEYEECRRGCKQSDPPYFGGVAVLISLCFIISTFMPSGRCLVIDFDACETTSSLTWRLIAITLSPVLWVIWASQPNKPKNVNAEDTTKD